MLLSLHRFSLLHFEVGEVEEGLSSAVGRRGTLDGVDARRPDLLLLRVEELMAVAL